MSFKFDPMNQTFIEVIEVKEASWFGRLKRTRVTNPLAYVMIVVFGLAFNYVFWNAIIALTSN
ncbi:hypothetical protein [Sulfuricurvum sp.]|uniref:hypothetical protein n=1 Tax=Sulfuricurvum sp. TaxID=2025608 RepID=UPI00262123A0|nr:hypothetical protein [Sulfuricurvum sp.]MDD2782104.1 hypothetical protein [Sulfuricurvum sp.]